MNYKEIIVKYQSRHNWTTHRMAVEAGLNPSTVSNWFTRNTTPTTDAIEKLCFAFGITMSEFFNRTDEICTLTNMQEELLKQWNCLYENEKVDFLQLLTTINKNRQEVN